MNYEAVTEIALMAGLGFSFLAVWLFFALEVPVLLREMREIKGKTEAEEAAERGLDGSEGLPEAAETVLMGSIPAEEPGETDESPEPEREWTSFGFLKWEISVRSRR